MTKIKSLRIHRKGKIEIRRMKRLGRYYIEITTIDKPIAFRAQKHLTKRAKEDPLWLLRKAKGD